MSWGLSEVPGDTFLSSLLDIRQIYCQLKPERVHAFNELKGGRTCHFSMWIILS